MSPNEIYVCIEGYEKRMQGEWERARMMMFTIHTHSMTDKRYKKNSAKKFMPLPWDEGETVKVAKNPQEVLEAHRARMAALKQAKTQ
jgi:hypothetical protein